MTTNGKHARKQSGLNRYEFHRLNHQPKSAAKRRRMHWVKGRTRDKTT